MGAPFNSKLTFGLGHSLHRASQYMDDLFATASGDHDLTARQLIILEIVARSDKPSQTEICQLSGIDRSTIADMVRRLVKKGYLVRPRSRTDARRVMRCNSRMKDARPRECALPIARDVEARVLAMLNETHRPHFLLAFERLLEGGRGTRVRQRQPGHSLRCPPSRGQDYCNAPVWFTEWSTSTRFRPLRFAS